VRGGGVEPHVPIAYAGERIGHLRGTGQRAFTLVKSPDPHQRSHGDVERPFTLPAVCHAVRQELKELGRQFHGSNAGCPVHLAPFAVRLVIRQQPVQTVDFVEGGVGRCFQLAPVVAVEHDREGRSHGFVAELDALQNAG
jgi:hypothetical protein